ncbi:hypothetical protein F4679DRAFT_44147 [Xylaria curta]|nr:hypothetical protein F4679DRAFT_44147 [Xylaria curta]
MSLATHSPPLSFSLFPSFFLFSYPLPFPWFLNLVYSATELQSLSNRMNDPVPPLRLLSIDGGGVRGLASLIIINHLMKGIDRVNPPKPCEYFDLIGGTSTGGLESSPSCSVAFKWMFRPVSRST